MEEHIFKMAGAGGGDGQAEAALVKAIREAGKNRATQHLLRTCP